ncbi:MAG: ATP-binding protein [Promethearchaeota archaeon]
MFRSDYETSFIDILKERDEVLYGRLRHIEETIPPSLEYWNRTHPEFTPHGFSHSQNIVEIIDCLVPDELKEGFKNFEIFFLVIGAWLHDWGMSGDLGISSDENRPIHHEHSQSLILENFEKLGLNQQEAEIIGDLAAGHRIFDIYDVNNFDNETVFGRVTIRKGFLAALIKLADEMDMTHQRIRGPTTEIANPRSLSSIIEFRRHSIISGIAPTADKTGIKVSGVARDPEDLSLINDVVDKLRSTINYLKPILHQFNLKYRYVEKGITTRGFLNEPIGLNIDKKEIIQLLIGRTIYNRKDIAIRELIQNAIDACLRMKWKNNHNNLKIRINITEDYIEVIDNGIGMTPKEAKKFLSTAGSSINRLLKEENETLPRLLGQFGIGFLTCFLIMEKIEIWTQPLDDEGRYFLIRSIEEGWRPNTFNSSTTGTKIKITLNEQGRRINWTKALEEYIILTEFPILLNEQPWVSENERRISDLASGDYKLSIAELREKFPWFYDHHLEPNFIPPDKQLEFSILEKTSSKFYWKVMIFHKGFRRLEMKSFESDEFSFNSILNRGVLIRSFYPFLEIGKVRFLLFLNFIDSDIELDVRRRSLLKSNENNRIFIDLFIDIFENLPENFKSNLENVLNFISNVINNNRIPFTIKGKIRFIEEIKTRTLNNVEIKILHRGELKKITLEGFFKLDFSKICILDLMEGRSDSEILLNFAKLGKEVPFIITTNIEAIRRRSLQTSFSPSRSFFREISSLLFFFTSKITEIKIISETDLGMICTAVDLMNVDVSESIKDFIINKNVKFISAIFETAAILRSNPEVNSSLFIYEQNSLKRLNPGYYLDLSHSLFREISKLPDEDQRQFLLMLIDYAKGLDLYFFDYTTDIYKRLEEISHYEMELAYLFNKNENLKPFFAKLSNSGIIPAIAKDIIDINEFYIFDLIPLSITKELILNELK